MTHLPAGRYYPGQSILHRLDARVKLLCLFALIAALVLTDTPAGYAISLLATAGLIWLSGLPVSLVLAAVRRLWLFFAVIFLMNVLFYGGEPFFSLWIFRPSAAGMLQGVNVVLRVGLIMVIGNILTATTSPMDITRALNWMFSPLRLVRIPAEEATMIISVAIQFIPTLMEETEVIKKAQTARGARFESRRLFERAGSLLPMAVPVFLSAFKRADELSVAMEARGYRGARRRTKYRAARLHGVDYAALGACVLLCAAQAVI